MKVILMLVAVYALIINQSLKTNEVISSSPGAVPEVKPRVTNNPGRSNSDVIFGVYRENTSLQPNEQFRNAHERETGNKYSTLSPVYPIRGIKMAALSAAR